MQNCLSEVLLTPSGLLTTLVHLYLNAGKPTKQACHIILKIQLLPQAQRGTPKSSSSFLAAVNYCPVHNVLFVE